MTAYELASCKVAPLTRSVLTRSFRPSPGSSCNTSPRNSRSNSPNTTGSFLTLPENAHEFDTDELLDDKKSSAPFSAKIDIFSTRIKSVLENQDWQIGKEVSREGAFVVNSHKYRC